MTGLDDQLITIFCQMDDFCKALAKDPQGAALIQTGRRGPACGLTLSDIMTVVVMAQFARYRDFKTYYIRHVLVYWRGCFKRLPTYERFVILMKRAMAPLYLLLRYMQGAHTGIYYIDSTCLPVCHLKRSRSHRTFNGVAQYGRTSVDWFFGLKLHLVMNEQAQLMQFSLTSGHTHDSHEAFKLLASLKGWAFGDKGYLGQPLFEQLQAQGVKLITRRRKNMKPTEPLSSEETQRLNQRGLIETVFGHLKQHYQLWHTRHRAIWNAFTHLFSALSAYIIQPLSPAYAMQFSL